MPNIIFFSILQNSEKYKFLIVIWRFMIVEKIEMFLSFWEQFGNNSTDFLETIGEQAGQKGTIWEQQSSENSSFGTK